MKILNDSEHRIFLSAMSRERKVCKSEDFFDYDSTNKLLDICDSIERKINDAEPVRHGHWIDKTDYDLDTYYTCSSCGEDFYTVDGTPKDNGWNYCPNCGAKMLGGAK